MNHKWFHSLVLALGVGCVSASAVLAHVQPQLDRKSERHDKTFWRSIKEHEYQVPPGNSVRDLAAKLNAALSSPDPEMRDELATSILSVWIYKTQVIDVETLRLLSTQWLSNLDLQANDRSRAPTWRRSFSALMLSVVVARDNAWPFLTN